ncbi:hypothetical protein [Actinokineospora pegani]|uniref:hypothetical protein n=1 Tax=Actinokineospora pegani TaxID=2654637 RepID=UPI0012EA8F10|nr:hypothetical protein [Actinokineospora pegani]
MDYQLTADVTPAPGTPDLDPLQQHGVAALLDEQLDLLAGIEGPDGLEVEPLDHRVEVHGGGAVITWLLDAPALAFAEEAARHVLTELLTQTDLLSGWSVGRCEVIASDDDLEAALNNGPVVELTDDDLGEALTDEEIAELREGLLAAAPQLRGVGLEAFGHVADDPACAVSEEAARLVAGALVQGIEVLTDDLFTDVQDLEDAEASVADVDAVTVLNMLPQRYTDLYGPLFAKQFLVTTVIMGYRLAQPGWTQPLCTAEALALHLLKNEAAAQLEVAGLLDELPMKEIMAAFDEHVLVGVDHERLFDTPEGGDGEDDIDLLGTPGLDFDEWFLPRNAETVLHPYLAVEDDGIV